MPILCVRACVLVCVLTLFDMGFFCHSGGNMP